MTDRRSRTRSRSRSPSDSEYDDSDLSILESRLTALRSAYLNMLEDIGTESLIPDALNSIPTTRMRAHVDQYMVDARIAIHDMLRVLPRPAAETSLRRGKLLRKILNFKGEILGMYEEFRGWGMSTMVQRRRTPYRRKRLSNRRRRTRKSFPRNQRSRSKTYNKKSQKGKRRKI